MISTKNIAGESAGSSVPKTLQPGNHLAKITSIKLEASRFDANAYNIMLGLEGPDMGSDFEGFWIDKDNQSLGRHKGQVGRVRLSEYAYQDGTTKSGIKVSRDYDILRAVQNLCKATDNLAWFDKQDNQHETIESLVEAFGNDAPFKDTPINWCIGGKEYQNKEGYTNYDLYVVRPVKGGYSYESASVEPDKSKLTVFNESLHIKKKRSENVSSFGDTGLNSNVTTSSSVSNDFEL
jgi:hypothetical protein